VSTPKLILFYLAWLLAAGAIAVTVAVVVTELLVLIGPVDRSGSGYGTTLTITTVASFVLLALVPFVYRNRFAQDEQQDEPS